MVLLGCASGIGRTDSVSPIVTGRSRPAHQDLAGGRIARKYVDAQFNLRSLEVVFREVPGLRANARARSGIDSLRTRYP